DSLPTNLLRSDVDDSATILHSVSRHRVYSSDVANLMDLDRGNIPQRVEVAVGLTIHEHCRLILAGRRVDRAPAATLQKLRASLGDHVVSGRARSRKDLLLGDQIRIAGSARYARG